MPQHPASSTLDSLMEQGARMMWVGAHPDDEILVGALMAKASLVCRNPIYFLVLNHGDGGSCLRPEGCHPDVATVRGKEMIEVAELYKAQLQHEYFYNAPLPANEFPKRHEIAKLWMEYKDPALVCGKAIREFKPDVLFTFHPDHGATGHPEHQLASRFATAGIRLAADEKQKFEDLMPHQVNHVYYGLNKYWPVRMIGQGDPGPITEFWNAKQLCIDGKSCLEIMAGFTKPHQSQSKDMGAVRKIISLISRLYFYRADPLNEINDPYEVVT